MLRLAFLVAALSLGGAAFAQAPTSTSVQQVRLLAPQLLAFAGSSANFESLVNGLTQGTPVTLTTLAADGSVQIVTFLPGTTLSALDAARSLEATRQSLITQGVATPNAQQLAIALMGGTLPTPAGSTPVTGVVSGNAGTTPIQVRNELAAPPLAGTPGGNVTAASLQALRSGLAQGAAGGRALSDFEFNQAVQLATVVLAQQGILDPTPEQLRTALLGGTLATAVGGVPVQGILQGQVRNTSDSRLFGTSDSRVLGTSNTVPNTNPQPRGVIIPRAGAPLPTRQGPPLTRR